MVYNRRKKVILHIVGTGIGYKLEDLTELERVFTDIDLDRIK